MKPEFSAEELTRTVRDGFLPIVREAPGFAAYFVVANEEARTWISIGIFADKAGSDESTERAIEFGQRGTHDWVEPDPSSWMASSAPRPSANRLPGTSMAGIPERQAEGLSLRTINPYFYG